MILSGMQLNLLDLKEKASINFLLFFIYERGNRSYLANPIVFKKVLSVSTYPPPLGIIIISNIFIIIGPVSYS